MFAIRSIQPQLASFTSVHWEVLALAALDPRSPEGFHGAHSGFGTLLHTRAATQ